jgi:hypothetical protein
MYLFLYFHKGLEVHRRIYCGNPESGVIPFRLANYTISCKTSAKVADAHFVIERLLMDFILGVYRHFQQYFNYIMVVEDAGVPGENHRPWASNW